MCGQDGQDGQIVSLREEKDIERARARARRPSLRHKCAKRPSWPQDKNNCSIAVFDSANFVESLRFWPRKIFSDSTVAVFSRVENYLTATCPQGQVGLCLLLPDVLYRDIFTHQDTVLIAVLFNERVLGFCCLTEHQYDSVFPRLAWVMTQAWEIAAPRILGHKMFPSQALGIVRSAVDAAVWAEVGELL